MGSRLNILTFQYDEEGQLTDAYYGAIDPVTSPHSPVRIDYFPYDELGNRKGQNHLAGRGWIDFPRRDNGLNQYRSWSPSIINYDDDLEGAPGNGVVMQEGTIAASYNALNQPNWIWSAGGFVSFGFDPLGRCVKRWGGGSDPATNPATYFYYDGWNLVQEGPSAGIETRLYFHGGRVDEIVASYNAATDMMAYHYYDASGHCTMLTDWQGNILEQYYYDAFGFPYFYNGAGNWLGQSPHGNRFLFTGREWLKDLKLYDYRHRLYQPELGRFLQPDPVGLQIQGATPSDQAAALYRGGEKMEKFASSEFNLYRYCHNDPINKSDPTGLYVTYGGKWTEKDAENFRKIFDREWNSPEGRQTWVDRYASKDEFRVVPDREAGTHNGGAAGFNIFTPAPADYKGPTYDSNSPMAGGQSNRNFEKKEKGDNTGVNKMKQDAAREAGLNREQQRLLHDTDTRGLSYREIRDIADKIKSGQITGGNN